MKKLLILTLVLSSIFLTSCGNEKVIKNINEEILFYEKGEGDFFNDYSYIQETYNLLSKTKMIKLGDEYNINFDTDFKYFELNQLTNNSDEEGNVIYGEEVKKIIQERVIDKLEYYKKEKCLIQLKEEDFMKKLLNTKGLDFNNNGNKYGFDNDELFMKGLIEEYVKRHKKTIDTSVCNKYIKKTSLENNDIQDVNIFN